MWYRFPVDVVKDIKGGKLSQRNSGLTLKEFK